MNEQIPPQILRNQQEFEEYDRMHKKHYYAESDKPTSYPCIVATLDSDPWRAHCQLYHHFIYPELARELIEGDGETLTEP